MGEIAVVTGRILTFSQDQNLLNLQVISELPSQSEDYSNFTREMFTTNTIKGKDSYVLGLARSYKNIECRWENWISDFELILKKMKWDTVSVYLETEFFGTHQYMWLSKYYDRNRSVKRKFVDGMVESDDWYFGKGFRNIFGTLQSSENVSDFL